MKSDLDRIMQAEGIDVLLITGPAAHNPPMYYMTGGGHLSKCDLIKQRGEAPVLFCNDMERDEAAKTGLAVRDYGEYKLNELMKANNQDMVKAVSARYELMFKDLGITQGRVALFGKIDAGAAYAVYSTLAQSMPGLSFVGKMDDSLLLEAMATKDEHEIARIHKMGQVTTQVVGQVADFLTGQRVEHETLVTSDGKPLTIGDVKRRINLWLAERGAENPEGTIFAIGRDAGVPHSAGTDGDLLRLGQTIVFDIFPCEEGGGYFYDFTRTWCLGYAPDEAQKLYEDVKAIYTQIMSELKAGTFCPDYQQRTCDLFEARGHATVQSDPRTQSGYVHSLGHGVGLNIHERPWFGRHAAPSDKLEAGSVVTIEPGLYYPERGMGCRLEDTVWVRPDGAMQVLADYPLDLVLPVRS
jgi:Xaa-Pro aminopeptidase